MQGRAFGDVPEAAYCQTSFQPGVDDFSQNRGLRLNCWRPAVSFRLELNTAAVALIPAWVALARGRSTGGSILQASQGGVDNRLRREKHTSLESRHTIDCRTDLRS
jgi:hypothetical protein